MFSGFEIYRFDDLFLDEEIMQKFSIKTVTNIEILTLLSNYDKVLLINNSNFVNVDKTALQKKILNSDNNYCCITKNDVLFLFKVEVLYGIRNKSNIISLYTDKKVRDAKLVNSTKINSLYEDISMSANDINEINKQKQLLKKYNALMSTIQK